MHPIKRLFFILLLSFCWSPSFLFIKFAIETLPPFTIVTYRLGIAAFFMIGILILKRRKLPLNLTFWKHISFTALFSTVIPFSLFCYAEQTIESALAAILNGTSPMFTALLAHYTLASDRLSTQKSVGIFLSLFGLVFLFSPGLNLDINGSSFGMIAALTASSCYAFGHVYAKKYLTGYPSFIVPTAQLIAGTLILSPIAFTFDPFVIPSFSSLMGVCGLALFGTFTAFLLYYYLLEHCGPTAISTSACLFPIGGMLLGFFFLGENLAMGSVFAALLILLGAMLVNQVFSWKSSTASTLSPIANVSKSG